MGLDMYLKASKYIGGWERCSEESRKQFASTVKAAGFKKSSVCKDSPSIVVNMTVVYWRKANAIHKWFVDNCQNGKDECQDTYVERDSLKALLKVCEEVWSTKNSSLLPPQSGFFFGSTDVDDWYWADVKRTIAELKKVLADESLTQCDFIYHSSW